MELTDIHCHILPGIDDGPEDGRTAVRMLKRAYKEGVRWIIVTPHYRAGMFPTTRETMIRRCGWLRKTAADVGLQDMKIDLGCEFFRSTGMSKMLRAGLYPTMAGSRYVLVEFSAADNYSRVRAILYELKTAGYIPIIAHAERYPVFVKSPENIEDAIALGAKIQVNADSVLGKHGWKIKHCCKKMMQREEIDFIGSDAHDLEERPSRLGKCAEYVEKKWGKDTARRIFVENPMKITACN